jgi:hypothetical protein
MIFEFGSGVMYGTKINDDGSLGTGRVFGILQGGSVDFAATNKQLFGTYQFPVAVGRGTAKISGKASFAQIYPDIYNDLFFRGTIASGVTRIATDEACLVGTPHTTHTTVVTNSGTFVQDLGVKDSTGAFMTRVTSGPAAGQYSVSAGTYTFNASDTPVADGVTVQISYEYTVAATGQTITITNPLLGTAPAFELRLQQTYLAQTLYIKLNRAISSKLTFATKLEDFTIPEFDFDAFADGSNNIGKIAIG